MTTRIRKRPGLLSSVWRWSWIVTLPATIVFAVLAVAVASRYDDFGLRHRVVGRDSERLLYIGKMELGHLARRAELALLGRGDLADRQLRQVFLFVDESSEKALNENLPHSGRRYVEARLLYPDGEIYDVKLRYRGDFWWHWAFFKKSLRIRTKKKDLFEGMRAFNLIAPKFDAQINNWAAYRLADMMGLVTPRHQLVNLWVNGRNRGVHLLVEQPEELTLRQNQRMPGDFYSGELVARDFYQGLRNDLFFHPKLWRKIAVNNHYPEDSYAPIEALVRMVVPGGVEQPDPAELFDPELWGRFFAWEVLSQAFHYDNTHNWRLYYDPAKSRFEPIVWDPNGWHPRRLPTAKIRATSDARVSRIHRLLLSNSDFVAARQRSIEQFFAGDRDQAFLREVRDVIERLRVDVELDPNLGLRFEVLPPEKIFAAMARLEQAMIDVFEDVREDYLDPREEILYAIADDEPTKIAVRVSSLQPVTRLTVVYDRPVNDRVSCRLRYRLAGESLTTDVSAAVSVSGHSILVETPLVSDFEPSTEENPFRAFDPAPATYVVELEGAPPSGQIRDVVFTIGGGTRSHGKKVKEVPSIDLRGMTMVAKSRPVEPAGTWSGTRRIRGVEIVKTDLIIRPGTRVLFESDASLIVEGRLLAAGTPKHPIQFLPANPEQAPWGALILRGPGASSSVLKHCRLERGSGYKTPLMHYSAMLSIHDVDDVLISHCRLTESRVVDDMVHVVYGRGVRIEDSTFENALFDAIDLDVSTGVVDRCTFADNGNDALDLMDSQVSLLRSELYRSGDKGVSVGEGSTLFMADCLLQANQIGVESKDTSEAYLYNSRLVDNVVALNAYNKNWRYGRGGEIYMQNGVITGAGKAATIGRRSVIYVNDADVSGEVQKSKRIRIDRRHDKIGFVPDFAQRYSVSRMPARRGRDAN